MEMEDRGTYSDYTELLCEVLSESGKKKLSGSRAEDRYLNNTDDSRFSEIERLCYILPIIKWEVENGVLTKGCGGELYLYYRDYVNGRLCWLTGDREEAAIVRDLTECFHKAFPEGLKD